MKLKKLKTQKPIESRNDKSFGIQTYGENNDFPQKIDRLVKHSVTGFQCLNLLSGFINGRGFKDLETANLIINRKGEVLDDILRKISNDLAEYGGFALHLNYNALREVCEVFAVPFEFVRLGNADENGHIKKVAIHNDWGRQFTEIRPWKKEQIQRIDLFNPRKEIIEAQVQQAGGWNKYKGQILYYSGNGLTYPIPLYYSALTDLSTEEGLINISYRNARNRFMSAGLLVEIKRENYNTEISEQDILENNDLSKEDKDRRLAEIRRLKKEEKALSEALTEIQGDENAHKIAYARVESKEDIPQFIQLQTPNYDAEYDVTQKNVAKRIGAAFCIPPILRSENVSTGFDTDAMKSAYIYFNNITQTYRYDIERTLRKVFENWKENIDLDKLYIDPKIWL